MSIKNGFILIEILLASALAAIIGSILVTVLWQSYRAQAAIDNFADVYGKASILGNQLEHDIMGAFIPVQADLQPTTTVAPPKQPEAKKKEKEKPPPIDKIFYATIRENKLDTLTFITSNPLQVYWGAKVGKGKPKVARVVYQLKPDPDIKNAFILTRQEDKELDFGKYKQDIAKPIRALQIVDNIKALTVNYTYIVPQKDEKDVKEKEGKKVKEYKTSKDWPDYKELQKEGKEPERPPIPQLVEVSISFWDNKQERDTQFVFTIPIMVDIEIKPPEKKKNETKKKPETKLTRRVTVEKSLAPNRQPQQPTHTIHITRL